MKLEQRVAHWVDLGLTSYSELYDVQVRLAELRKQGLIKDIILTTEHYPEVNFGSAVEHNQFSDALLEEVKKKKGSSYTEQDVISLLQEKGIAFSKKKRGGGATAVDRDQVIFYPIVDYEAIVKRERGVGNYKNLIDAILYNVINQFNVPNLSIASGVIKTSQGVRERRDVWTNINGSDYKIGSKGIRISGKVAYHGFVIYANKKGVELFKYVKPCGYSPEEVGVISIEEVIKNKVNKEFIKQSTRAEIKQLFRYDQIKDITKAELKNILDSAEQKVEVR